MIQRTADIDTNDNITAGTFPEADAWAQKFLADHATPTVQMQIDGDEYFAQTGDTLDRARLNYLCAVPLPEYGQDFEQRIVSVHYPNALSDPRHVTASLSTQLPKFSTSIRSLQKQAAANARASRSIARSAAKAKEMTNWSMVVTDQQLALDGTGIMQLYESGIDMDAHGGVVIYNLAQGLQSLYSGIEVQAGRINLVVQGEGSSASINIQAIVDGINGSVATINANHIKLNANDTITLDAKLSINANTGRLSVNGALDVSSNVYVHGDTYIDGAIEMYDTFYGDSESFQAVTARFGASGSGVSQRILGHRSLLVGLDAVVNGGQIEIKFADNSDGNHNSANFNIAATQYYIDGVAAAYNDGYAAGQAAGGGSASDINLANSGSIWTHNSWSGVPPALSGITPVDLNSLSAFITDGNSGESVIFRACLGPESSATDFKYYRIKIGYT